MLKVLRFTRESLAKQAAESWKKQYVDANYNLKILVNDKFAFDIYEELLGVSDPDEVDRIIGNKSWTRGFCSSCHEYKDSAVFLFELCEYSLTVCDDCLQIVKDA